MSKILIVLCAFLMLTLTPSVKADPIAGFRQVARGCRNDLKNS